MRNSMYFSALLLSNAAAALGFFFLTAQGFFDIPAETRRQIFLFFQWQPLLLTVAKFGLDAYVFSVIDRENQVLHWKEFYYKKIMPTIILLFVFSVWFFNPFFAVILALTIAFDVFSTIAIAQANAQQHFHAGLLGTLAYFPLFFLFFFLMNIYLLDSHGFLVVFLGASVLRAIIVFSTTRPKKNENAEVFLVPSSFAFLGLLQQVINYFVFRLDQMLVVKLVDDHVYIQKYMFFSKYAELASSFFVVFGAIYFKKSINLNKSRIPQLLLGYIACAGLITFLYAKFGGFGQSYGFIIAYTLGVTLIILVNYQTYLILKQQAWTVFFMSGIGACLVVLALFFTKYYILMFPISLVTYLVLAFLFSWVIRKKGGGYAA